MERWGWCIWLEALLWLSGELRQFPWCLDGHVYHFHLHSLNRIYHSLVTDTQRWKANGTKNRRLRSYYHSHHVHSFQCDLLVFGIFYVKKSFARRNNFHNTFILRTYGCYINTVWKKLKFTLIWKDISWNQLTVCFITKCLVKKLISRKSSWKWFECKVS